VTAAYVFVDLEKLVLRYGGAGHPPLLLPRAATRTRGSPLAAKSKPTA